MESREHRAALTRFALLLIAVATLGALVGCGGGNGSGGSGGYRPPDGVDTGGGSFTYFRSLDTPEGTLVIHEARPTRDGGAILTGNRVREQLYIEGYENNATYLATPSLAIVRVGPDGNRIWAREIGAGTAADYAFNKFTDVVPTADGGYLMAGESLRGASLVKLGSDRRVLWQRYYGGQMRREILRLLPMADGGAILAGAMHRSGSQGTGWLWLARIDASGQVLQERTEFTSLRPAWVLKQRAGTVYVAGDGYILEFDPSLSGDPLAVIRWEPERHTWMPADAVAFDRTVRSQAQGYFVVEGEALGASSGGSTSGVRAITRDGDEQWYESRASHDFYRGLALDTDPEHVLAVGFTPRMNRSQRPVLRRFARVSQSELAMTDVLIPAPPAGTPTPSRLLGIMRTETGDHILYGGTPHSDGHEVLWVGLMERQTRRLAWARRVDERTEGSDYYAEGPTFRGGSRLDRELASPAKQTSDGGFVLTFTHRVYKFDGTGNVEFTLPRVRNSGETGHSALEMSQGDLLVAAGARAETSASEPTGGSLLRLRADGSLRWRRVLPDHAAAIALVEMSNDSAALLAVESSGGMTAVKLDANGDILWRSNVLQPECTRCLDRLIATQDGGLLAHSSGTLVKLDSLGSEVWTQVAPEDFTIDRIVQLRDGDYLLAGQHAPETRETDDADEALLPREPMLARLGADGSTVRWMRSYALAKHPLANVTAVASPDGGATFATTVVASPDSANARCYFYDDDYLRHVHMRTRRACSDIALVHVDGQGSVRWHRSYATASTDFAEGIAAMPDNGMLVWGQSDAFGYPYFGTALLRTDADGNVAPIVIGSDGNPSSVCPVSLGARLGAPHAIERALTMTSATASSRASSATFAESQDISTGELELVQARACLSQNQAPVLRIAIDGAGTVTSSPEGIDCGTDCEQAYPTFTEVELTASAAEGSRFAGWGGQCASFGTRTPVTLQLFADQSCTARFTAPSTGDMYAYFVAYNEYSPGSLPVAGDPVVLDAFETRGRIVRYDWDYDSDGIIDYSVSVDDPDAPPPGAHVTRRVFPTPGRYHITMTATDADGRPGIISRTIEVTGPPPVLDTFSMTLSPTSATVPRGGTAASRLDFSRAGFSGDQVRPYVYCDAPISCSLSDDFIRLDTPVPVTLTVNAGAAPAGTYSIVVNAYGDRVTTSTALVRAILVLTVQ